MGLGVVGTFLEEEEPETQPETFQLINDDTSYGDPQLGRIVHLANAGGQAYTITDSSSDKKLVWDADADSYYDESTDCWLWYNTDVEPAVWQYWYEGMSSDFGDCGWMEHDEDGWFIEESYGNWIELPDVYDPDSLWYITSD